MQDIAPDLLKKILELFAEKTERDPTIAAILEHIDAGTATAEDVQRFAIALGGHESDALLDVLTSDVLPDGKMYYNIAERTVRPTIEQSHELFGEAAAQIQKQLNENAGIGLQPVAPKLDEERVRGIIDKISDAPLFEDVRWVLNEPIRVLVQSFADEFVKANAEFQADAGLSPTITRTVVGGCCQWCRALAGKYTYPNDVPDDVYRRHAYCRCLVTYDPGDGSKRVQDVHSKKWKDYAGQADEDLPGVKIEQRRGVVETGAKRTVGWQDRHADLYYEEVRNRKPYADARRIAKNVQGFTEDEIEEIRQHVFIRLQPRDGGMYRFDPDYEQAEAWQRLVEGRNIKESDIVFLQHEHMEQRIMREMGCNYEEAHAITERTYNWREAIKRKR